jgi:hypothetical protein
MYILAIASADFNTIYLALLTVKNILHMFSKNNKKRKVISQTNGTTFFLVREAKCVSLLNIMQNGGYL